MVIDNNYYMDLCLQEAWKYQGLTYPNPAVGALILDANGKLLAIEAHKNAGDAHAELSVISKTLEILGDANISSINDAVLKHKYILENHNDRFKGFTIYVTLEPCNHQGRTPSCSLLLKTLKFDKVIIGAIDPNKKATGGAKYLKDSNINVVTNVLQKKCEELIEPFLKWQTGEPYIFFKLAISSNGVYTGGTISSKNSRIHVHKLREKIDLLAIGGNTVRVDRPTLDCRFTDGDAPDILIYSNNKTFDKKILLFTIPNRKVIITDTLEDLKNYKFIMIEGGEGMLKATAHLLDHLLIYRSNNFKTGKTIQLDLKLEKIYGGKIDLDKIEWFKII